MAATIRREFPLTDSGNADAFAASYRDCVAYDWAGRQWFYFDG